MMELVDMPGMPAKFGICRMRTANSKKVGGTLKGPFCAPKLGVPKICFGDLFCMRGGPFRKKCDERRAAITIRFNGKCCYSATSDPSSSRVSTTLTHTFCFFYPPPYSNSAATATDGQHCGREQTRTVPCIRLAHR